MKSAALGKRWNDASEMSGTAGYIHTPSEILGLKGYSQSIASTYKSYIFSKFDTRKKVFIVDSRTENFSAQRLIQEVLNKKVIGIYWDIIKTNNMHEIFDHIASQNLGI